MSQGGKKSTAPSPGSYSPKTQMRKEGAKILRILTDALQYKAKKTQVDSRQFWESIKPILYGKSPCVALWDLKGEGKFTRGNTFQCTLLNE